MLPRSLILLRMSPSAMPTREIISGILMPRLSGAVGALVSTGRVGNLSWLLFGMVATLVPPLAPTGVVAAPGVAATSPSVAKGWDDRRNLQLVMVEDRGCRYCLLWDREVGRGYARTPEGQVAPLKRVTRNSKLLSGLSPVIYTPTFILVDGNRELGRITGYPGQMYFWEELSALLRAAAAVHDVKRGNHG